MLYRLAGIEVNRDKQRLDAIRALSCCNCGASPRSQAAHSNFGVHGKARGLKAGDEYTIPLCVNCHQNFDQNLSQQTRQQQMDWFNEKLESTNETLKRAHDATVQNYPESF